jgi:uncharacterized protein
VRITHLWRYPVKSLSGEALRQTTLDPHGIPYDRSFRFVDMRDGNSGKALTARQIPQMLAFRASAASGSVCVESPDGSTVAPGEQLVKLLQTTFDRPLALEAQKPDAYPFFDDNDLLVINAASVRELSREMDIAVDIRRFRPSIVIDGADAQPYAEDHWVGKSFAAGTAQLDIVQRNVRCVITNIDPETFAVDPAFLKFLVDHHEQCFGVYARVRTPGGIALGDEWRPL